MKAKRAVIVTLIVLGIAAAGCSPEYTRVRGGDRGADIGNRPPDRAVEIHGPTNPSFGEPVIGRAVEKSKQAAR